MHIVNTLKQLIFTARDSAQTVSSCTSLSACAETAYRGGVAICAPYRDPYVRACVHECKFHQNRVAARLLGELFADWIDMHSLPIDAIVPTPLSRKRMRSRGHNQVATILNEYEKYTESPPRIYPHALTRIKNTQPQTELSKEIRKKNVRGAFALNTTYADKLRGAHIVLIDDVATTGATMRAAREALAEAKPASITCVALAG